MLRQKHLLVPQHYLQVPRRPPDGGPLSSLVANLFVDAPEQRFLDSDPLASCIRHWTHYMDDVLCVWHGSLLVHLNAIHPDLQFTMEVGGDKIKYLDITISLEECNNFLTPTFGIFRKPSFTGLSIHSSSLHPRFHKSACATSAIHQMLSISLNSAARLVETVIVKQIVAVNHLDINVVST